MHIFTSPIGELAVKGTKKGISALYFTDSAENEPNIPYFPWIEDTKSQIEAYFSGDLTEFHLPLDLEGSEFQLSVWDTLAREIPYGFRLNYSELAEKVGNDKAIRAVATACRKNPVAILVPCHRIVPKSGGVGQYNAGAWRKEFLLHLEARKSNYK